MVHQIQRVGVTPWHVPGPGLHRHDAAWVARGDVVLARGAQKLLRCWVEEQEYVLACSICREPFAQ